jgi:aspartokinase/homoserine dehydrogenase 1
MENPQSGMAGFGERDGLHPRRENSPFDLSPPVEKREEIAQEDVFHGAAEHLRLDGSGTRPLRIMKFGGTSVGDASCIERVIEIVREAAQECDVVVVVSAMSGVTNKLIEAATQSEAGNRERVALIFEELRKQHEATVMALVRLAAERRRLGQRMQAVFDEGDHLCQGTILLRELTLRARDSISSLGERLSAPLVAAALADRGVAAEAIEATELFVTDACHGAAEPRMDLTRERCQARLSPLLKQGVVPVLTGFIGATEEGVLTTLGRGGSDYSATILGSALDADEVIIWTDVDGVLTADPRLVHGARTIPEISYREAAELAYFGAKVLHPKTLRPVMQSDIPVWIRNTFAPELSGTKITPTGPPNGGGVKALTAIRDVALITVGGPGIVGMRDVLGRTFTTTAVVRADILLISQSSSQNDICFVVPFAVAKSTVEALRREFAQDLAHEKVEHITLDTTIAIVAVVGERMRGTPGIVARTLVALGRESVNIVAIAQGSSECNISVVVAQKDMKAALFTVHREFQLGAVTPEPVRGASSTVGQPEFSLPLAQGTEAELAQGMD